MMFSNINQIDILNLLNQRIRTENEKNLVEEAEEPEWSNESYLHIWKRKTLLERLQNVLKQKSCTFNESNDFSQKQKLKNHHSSHMIMSQSQMLLKRHWGVIQWNQEDYEALETVRFKNMRLVLLITFETICWTLVGVNNATNFTIHLNDINKFVNIALNQTDWTNSFDVFKLKFLKVNAKTISFLLLKAWSWKSFWYLWTKRLKNHESMLSKMMLWNAQTTKTWSHSSIYIRKLVNHKSFQDIVQGID